MQNMGKNGMSGTKYTTNILFKERYFKICAP